MREEIETPLSEEEQALARRGQELIAPAVGGVRAPRSLREAIERERQRAARRARRRSGAAMAWD
jgi:hypothetical protein